MAEHSRIACQHCGSMHVRVPVPERGQAACTQCGNVLYRQTAVPLQGWVALAVAALVVFCIANLMPLGTLTLAGIQVRATLPQALWLTWQHGHVGLAIMTGIFAFLLPLTQLLFQLWALDCLRRGRLPHDFRHGMRFLHRLGPWSMVPVLLLAIVVAIVKLAGMAQLTPDAGIAAFAALAVLMTILSRVTPQRLWRQAEDMGLAPVSGATLQPGQRAASCHACGYVQADAPGGQARPCERCGAKVRRRKENPLVRAAALVAAASILYLPANLLPVMWLRTPTGQSSHTILGGVIQLWQLGSWDLALIVFIASVVVPMTKLLALTLLLLSRRWKGVRVQRQRTHLYEMVEFIGQWSMLDVFVVVLLTAMADFPGLSQVQAGSGAFSFGLVVILTMLAAMSFDPRDGWDRNPDPVASPGRPAADALPDSLPSGSDPLISPHS